MVVEPSELPRRNRQTSVHPTAIVHPTAHLDKGVTVGPYAVIGENVHIGEHTWIGSHAVINGSTTIGKQNRIFQFVSLGEIPQDKKYQGEISELTIGDRNTIREFCTINRGTELDRSKTIVGNDNWIMAYVHIAHDCIVGNHTTFANGATLAGHVTVEDCAVLGGFTLVHQFCRIGAYSFCGMGTALNRDLPPFLLATGNLAKTHGLNKEGLKRHGFSDEVMQALHKVYLLMIKSRKPRADAQEQLAELTRNYSQVAYFVQFIENSKRGIIRQ